MFDAKVNEKNMAAQNKRDEELEELQSRSVPSGCSGALCDTDTVTLW